MKNFFVRTSPYKFRSCTPPPGTVDPVGPMSLSDVKTAKLMLIGLSLLKLMHGLFRLLILSTVNVF